MQARRLMIVDDEPLARARLRDLLADLGGYQVVAEAANGLDALTQCQTTPVQLVLVDIRMPGMDGIEFAQHAQRLAQPPQIIFTTAYDQFAVQAFELNAIDYLLKPIRAERLASALAKAKPLHAEQWQALQPLQSSHSHLSIQARGKLHLLPIADIIYARADLKYVTLRTASAHFLWEGALSQLAEQHAAHFVRIHRNALVARTAIMGFEKQRQALDQAPQATVEETWQVRLRAIPETLTVSRRQFAQIKALLP